MRLKGLEDPVQVMQVEFGLDLPVAGQDHTAPGGHSHAWRRLPWC